MTGCGFGVVLFAEAGDYIAVWVWLTLFGFGTLCVFLGISLRVCNITLRILWVNAGEFGGFVVVSFYVLVLVWWLLVSRFWVILVILLCPCYCVPRFGWVLGCRYVGVSWAAWFDVGLV